MTVQHVRLGSVPDEVDGQLFVSAVTRDVSARVELVRQLPGEAVLLLFPDHETALRTFADVLRPPDPDPVSDLGPDPDGDAVPAVVPGGLLVDPLRLDVTWNGIPLRLTRLERAVLARLAEPPVRAWSYESLYRAAWGDTWLGDTSALHATVKRLRRKLREAGVTVILESIRGIGFRLNSSGPVAVPEAAARGAEGTGRPR